MYGGGRGRGRVGYFAPPSLTLYTAGVRGGIDCVSLPEYSGGSRILKKGGNDISKVDLRGRGEGRPLRAEFALSTVATVTRVIARYETCAEE